jgi:hypothetical protein
LSFEKIGSESLPRAVVLQKVRISDDKFVEVKTIGDLDLMVFNDAGTEIIIDGSERSGTAEPGSSRYTDVTLEAGRYIKFKVYGWEWMAVRLYDTQTKKRSVELPESFQNGFTKDGKYFYACALSHFGGERYVDIYAVPEFEKHLGFFEENKEYSNGNTFIHDLSCVYEKNKNTLKVSIDYFDTNEVGNNAYLDKYRKKSVWEYSFRDKSLKKIR